MFWEILGAGRDSRYSGARRGIGASGAPEGCRESVWGCQGCVKVCRGVFGASSD